ncbi:MAG: outer membrane lipoprotein-sorting protein [Vicinamibacterales bacterium]
MSRLFFIFLISHFLNTWAGNTFFLQATNQPQGRSPQERGTWVARAVQDRETGRDGRTTMRMRLFDRQNRERERALTILSMKGGAGRPVPGDRSLTRFTYPNDIAGTGFLVWENPEADDERFLYLPSLGRVRRIAGSETQDSFVGSDFTYEDIGGREFNDYTYTLLDENAQWTAPDGTTHPAYRLESRHKDPRARFPRIVSLVRKDNFVVVRGEIHNRRDELQKVFDVRRLERISGIWTVMDMVMADTLGKTRTELVIEKAEYNVGLKADDFSRRELERGAR